jgi:alpha-glucuronidase
MIRILVLANIVLALLVSPTTARAEDGYELWLRYRLLDSHSQRVLAPAVTGVFLESTTPTLEAAATELRRGIGAMVGRVPGSQLENGSIALGTPATSEIIRKLKLPLHRLGEEGYLIRSITYGGRRLTLIAANSDKGVLYGTFALLRRMQVGETVFNLNISDRPDLTLRVLNHWDNLDGFVERGYAGKSLWDWSRLPQVNPRIIDYARANASVGINGTVLNNVNAEAEILSPAYLQKVRALADTFRPYGIKVYLSARFSAPIDLGQLTTADPLDPKVRIWWKAKADEIYRVIPDFGGFLVKANSEGQPGPQGYGRSHADGANMLAKALEPHGGTVFWRAFVYAMGPDDDRIRAAYDEFKALDGKFSDNVILQVKNGPLDFQPREPFSPLFGAMGKTKLAMEVQLTKEYLGYSDHLAYLGTMWAETLRSRTARPRLESIVADSLTAMAGVANAGTDRNWSGSHFDQSNWYAFGRLAWHLRRDPATIAEEWARLTWSNDRGLVQPVVSIMMGSRQAAVDYMTPLGLTHLMGTGHHHGPAPWVSNLSTPSWNPTYFHQANADGIGFDRTSTGSNAVAQYAPEVARSFANLNSVSDDYLLWFHHVPWTHRMRSGRPLWSELVHRYDRGLNSVERMSEQWSALKSWVDPQRHSAVTANLRAQGLDAMWWRDASISYWQSLSQLPLPEGHQNPARKLQYYQAIEFKDLPGNP